MKKIPKRPDRIRPWERRVQKCTECQIHKYCDHKVTIRRSHPSEPFVDILFIGEAPGQAEYSLKEPFIGPAGNTLNTILEKALHPNTKYIVTNTVMCTPFYSQERGEIREPTIAEMESCAFHLQDLIEAVKPKTVIALGKVAHKSCTKILNVKIPYIHVLHPSKIMRSTTTYEENRTVLEIQQFLEKYGIQ